MILASTLEKNIFIGHTSRLTLSDCIAIAKGQYEVKLTPDSVNKMQKSYDFLATSIDRRIPIYGINTQFGDQVSIMDAALNDDRDTYYKSIGERQKNLIKSHCCGLGDIVPYETVKLAMALRAHCLSQGYSGVRAEVVHAFLAFINNDLIPIVRQYGSIGASGDLIPLASIATAIIGEDTEVYYQGKIIEASAAIKQASLKTFTPEMREGLAMINGTSFMSAIASQAMYHLNRLFKQVLTSIAFSLESLMIIQSAYHPLVHHVKKQIGEIEVNDFLLNSWKGSQLLTDLDELRANNINDVASKRPIQDCYSLRSVAQGFGPFAENIKRATEWIENEINSVNDNPIIDADNKKIHHSANFMGYYVTDACDILKIDIAQASSWIHALLANLVHPRKNHGLPTSLVTHPEKFNGFRPLQLLAASIAVQNRKLAQSHPSYMLPTEGDNQDVNSLGTHAAYDLETSVANLERLTAILYITAIQALEFRDISKASIKAQAAHKAIRKIFPAIKECRPLTKDIENIISLMRNDLI